MSACLDCSGLTNSNGRDCTFSGDSEMFSSGVVIFIDVLSDSIFDLLEASLMSGAGCN